MSMNHDVCNGLSLRRNGAKAAGGASKRADDDKKPNPDADDEDEDERKNASVVGEDDENDKPGSKGRRAQEPDDDAEDDQDDVDAEDEDDEAGAEDDGDDDKDPKARKAAKAERTRAGKIIAHGIDKGCVEAASVLAFTTGMSSASAIRVLDQQAAANMRAARGANGLYGRMNAAQLPNPGPVQIMAGRCLLRSSSLLPENAAGAKRLNRRSTIQSS